MVSKYPSGQTVGRTLEEAGLRQFTTKLDNVQNGFKYMVSTDKGDSPWYTITVNPRPAIASLDIKYDYPTYTAMPSRTELNRDGTVEALIGTKITLTVHATGGPLSDTAEHKNQIVIQPTTTDASAAAAEPIKVSLAKVTDTDYAATFIVSTNATYTVELANAFGLTNKDIKHPHSIIAIPDQVPTIVIQSPAASVTVRPDDTVPVRYIATDDFGVSSVEALVQVDDKPQKSIKVRLPEGDRRNIKDLWKLALPTVLADAATGQQITYQLKVTDNRDPDPQFSFSTKQIIRIDRNTESFAQKLNAEEKAEARSGDRQGDRAAQSGGAEGSTAPQSRSESSVDAAGETAGPRNTAAAHRHRQGPRSGGQGGRADSFADVAKKVEQIADNPVQKSAEDVAKAELTPDTAAQRRAQDANQAQQQIADARQQLQALKNDVQQAEQKAEARRPSSRRPSASRGGQGPGRASRREGQERAGAARAIQKLQEAAERSGR